MFSKATLLTGTISLTCANLVAHSGGNPVWESSLEVQPCWNGFWSFSVQLIRGQKSLKTKNKLSSASKNAKNYRLRYLHTSVRLFNTCIMVNKNSLLVTTSLRVSSLKTHRSLSFLTFWALFAAAETPERHLEPFTLSNRVRSVRCLQRTELACFGSTVCGIVVWTCDFAWSHI